MWKVCLAQHLIWKSNFNKIHHGQDVSCFFCFLFDLLIMYPSHDQDMFADISLSFCFTSTRQHLFISLYYSPHSDIIMYIYIACGRLFACSNVLCNHPTKTIHKIYFWCSFICIYQNIYTHVYIYTYIYLYIYMLLMFTLIYTYFWCLLLYIHILTACRNFASSKEMTADATLEALEGTGFTGLSLSELRFNRLLRAVVVLYISYLRYGIEPLRYICICNMQIYIYEYDHKYFCIPIYKTTFGQDFVVCFFPRFGNAKNYKILRHPTVGWMGGM